MPEDGKLMQRDGRKLPKWTGEVQTSRQRSGTDNQFNSGVGGGSLGEVAAFKHKDLSSIFRTHAKKCLVW